MISRIPNKVKSFLTLNLIRMTLKALLIVGFIFILVKKRIFSISILETSKALVQFNYIIPAAIAFSLALIAGVTRWYWILKAQNIRLSWLKFFQLQMIGTFFNISLPGAVSGDFIKTFYIGKEIRGCRAQAFGSILFDRVVGLAGLILLSAIALLIGAQRYWGSKAFLAIQLSIGTATLGFLGFFAYLFLVREKNDPLFKMLQFLKVKLPKTKPLFEIYESVRFYRDHRVTVLQVLSISVLLHFLECYACFCLFRAFSEFQVSLLDLCLVVPLAKLAAALPLLPGGAGTGHVGFFYFCSLIGTQRGADVFTIYLLFQIIFGLLGGLVYLQFKETEPSFASVPSS